MAKTTKNEKSTKAPKVSKTQLNDNLTVSPKDRRGDFVRLAEGRAFRAIECIRLLGNLSNVSGYEFGQADVDVIMDTIKAEMAATEARFKAALQKTSRKPVKLAA